MHCTAQDHLHRVHSVQCVHHSVHPRSQQKGMQHVTLWKQLPKSPSNMVEIFLSLFVLRLFYLVDLKVRYQMSEMLTVKVKVLRFVILRMSWSGRVQQMFRLENG